MSKTSLKKYLSSLTKEEIVDIILALYDARKEAKEYLDFYLNPNCEAALDKCKKNIRNEFFPSRGFSDRPSFAKCRKIISDFHKLKPEPIFVADLMLFYIEQGCEYILEFGDMWESFYTTLEKNFDKAMRFIFLNGLLAEYYERIERLIDSVSECGWGFYDTLQAIYSEYRESTRI